MSDIKVRFIYEQPGHHKSRVMTLATQVHEESGTVAFAYAICRPDTWVSLTDEETFKTQVCKPGDTFSKSIGRSIATGRLINGKAQVLVLSPGDTVLQQVLRSIEETEHCSVARRMAVVGRSQL